MVDLGCGARKRPGAIGLDLAPIPGVDVLADVMRGLPLRDGCVDEIHASHIVEHVDDLLSFMGEVWRICKPETLVWFRFPHGSTKFTTRKDPTHKRAVFLATFEYFDPNTFDGAAFGYYHAAKFRIMGRRLNFNMNADTLRLRKARRMLRGCSMASRTAISAASTRRNVSGASWWGSKKRTSGFKRLSRTKHALRSLDSTTVDYEHDRHS